MRGQRVVRRFVADTESSTPQTVDRVVHHLNSVRVWGVGLCEIGRKDVQFFSSLDGFMRFLEKLDFDAVIYFHNLKWDAAFLLDWWGRHGWHFAEMNEAKFWNKPPERQIYTLMSNLGAVYSIKMMTGRGRLVEFRDSLKILPFTVEQIGKKFGGLKKLKGSIDYSAPRPWGHVLTDTEKAYIAHDVLIVANALNEMEKLHAGILNVLTIGSYSMTDFRSRFSGKKISRDFTYRANFPKIENDAFFRKAYRGGWCYVNEKYQDKELRGLTGKVFDVNSLYPSVMLQVFPRGAPKLWRGGFDKLAASDFPYFVCFEAEFDLKPGRFPFLQDKATLFRDVSHVSHASTPMLLTLSRPDFELFLECYEVKYMNVFEAQFFETTCSPFHSYIDYWREVKIAADHDRDGVSRTFAKLMLNSLYGKFAQSPVQQSRYPVYREGLGVRFVDFENPGGGGYIPIGAYITAYARGVIVRAANNNFDIFLYADTDSLHLLGEPAGLWIDPVEFGAFKMEGEFTAARYVRQKTYIEQMVDGSFEVRAAGMPQNVKEEFLRSSSDPVHDFTRGLEVFGKLMKKRVPGGAYLYPSTFKVR